MQRAIFGRVRSLAHACLMLVCSVSGATAAPVTAGSLPAPAIRGVVRDSSGTSLPNVTLTIASLRRVATSGPDGAFVFRGLPVGRYHIDAVLIGFARAEATVDVPATGDDVALTIVMHATPLRLSNVVVTATPEGGDALGITQSTVDLGGKELARSLSSSLAQTLESEPGMGSRYNGPAANMPIIRGLTGEPWPRIALKSCAGPPPCCTAVVPLGESSTSSRTRSRVRSPHTLPATSPDRVNPPHRAVPRPADSPFRSVPLWP